MNDELRKKYPGLDDEQIAQNERAFPSFQEQSKPLPEEPGLEEPLISEMDVIPFGRVVSGFGKLRSVLNMAGKGSKVGAKVGAKTGAEIMERAAINAEPDSLLGGIKQAKARSNVTVLPGGVKETYTTPGVTVKPSMGVKETYTTPGVTVKPTGNIDDVYKKDVIVKSLGENDSAIAKLSKIDAAKKAAEIKESQGPEAARKFANVWKMFQDKKSQNEGE